MPEHRSVALVTGAAQRVGRAIVQKLAEAGHDVAFTYHHSRQEALELAEELRRQGRSVLAIEADLTQPDQAVEAIHRAFTSQFSRLDVLVNNASLYEPADLAATDSALIGRLTAIHLESPLLLCRQFAPLLRASRGHVINMLDLLAERPWPQYLAYCASKAALWNLTLGLARELAPQVTVNGIAPGVVDWPDDMPESEKEKYLKRVPLARPGAPADVTEAVLYLCTGGSYLTGQVLRLDGGRSIT